MQVRNKQGVVKFLCMRVDCNGSQVDRVAFCILVFWYVEKERVGKECRGNEGT